MPELPPYLLSRPAMPTDAPTLAGFAALYTEVLAADGGEIEYTLAAARWQFLCHLADTGPIVLHGSGNPDIAVFEPRKSHDVNPFGDRQAVYAAGDGIWPIYYAVLDRERFGMSLINSAIRLELGDGHRSDPYYFFSITDTALAQKPYRRGTVYILPRDSFELQPSQRIGDRDVHLPHWASLTPVKPLARLSVGPEDFPFLDAIRGHDDETTFARARANPGGFPWLEEQGADGGP